MRTRTQNKVTGTSSEAGFHHGQQERAQDELQIFDSATVKVEHMTRGVKLHAKIPPAQAADEHEPMHPFKLFQYPLHRATPLAAGTEWRTWRVRGGALFIDVASGTFLDVAANTDGVDTPYLDFFDRKADGTVIDQATVTEIEADENAITYVWIELDIVAVPVSGIVKWGTDPTAEGWATWPAFDCKHINIGWIDTASRFDDEIAIPRQILIEDVYGVF